MLEKVNPWLELVRLFARLRRRRIRSFRFTRKASDVRGRRFNPVSREYELPTMSSSSGQNTRYNLMETHSNGVRRFHGVRKLVILLGLLNWTLCLISTYVAMTAAREGGPRKVVIAADMIAAGAALRLLWMLGMGFTQAVTASAMISRDEDANVENRQKRRISGDEDADIDPKADRVTCSRQRRRKWYKWWLWWSRIGFLVTAVQALSAAYFLFLIATKCAQPFAYSCSGGVEDPGFKLWLVVAPILAWAIVTAQCCVGSDVIAWRSLYHDHDEAWRAHHQEMFDYGIREFMCCLGRRQYLSQLDKDEVDSVAALLGELLEYRAKGASHLDLVAGIALLREQKVQALASDGGETAPEKLLSDAADLHPYAVAAYTGFLLDLGRNPFTWIWVWLRRQGALTFWNRNKRPKLEGDNWWRGHAAAFLRHARLPPEDLLEGRISQKNRETVYFVVVLRQSKTVVVTVRGTETPEDLLTDGLGRECELSDSDLLGLLKGDKISDEVKQQVQDTKPHYCHVGVIQAARELSIQLDNLAEDVSDEQALNDLKGLGDSEDLSLLERRQGLLTQLLGPGGKFAGYKLRFVGHSLGGSIAALTALRLYKRYPDLHVFAYGVLPCVDAVTADACASFVTSVIYNDEYSSRLSVAAIMRLRDRALLALESNSETDSTSLAKLAWSLFWNSEQTNSSNVRPGDRRSVSLTTEIYEDEGSERDNPAREHLQQQWKKEITGSQRRVNEEKPPLMEEQPRHSERTGESSMNSVAEDEHRNPGSRTAHDLLPNGMPKDGVEEKGSDLLERWPEEMYVPGLVIHLVKKEEPSEHSLLHTFFHSMRFCEEDKAQYSAVLKDRKSFRDVVVSPNMFIDHAPWRCQHAMNEVIKKLRMPSTSASGSLELASELV